MKARHWQFDKYMPDQEDIEAESKAREAFWALNQELLASKTPAVENHVHCFVSGFYRGVAWALAKHGVALPEKVKVDDLRIVYGVAIRGTIGNWGFIAGPYPKEKDALDFVPNEGSSPIFLLKMETQEQNEPTYTPLYRWHDGQMKWRPIKRRTT